MDTFEIFRPTLFGIAYRMLGSAMEAEDMVQEAYLRFQAVDPATIQTPEAFLRTVVTRLSLDRLKAAQTQRESYPGEWLPEPILTPNTTEMTDPAEQASQHDAISLAFMLLLESLSPDERAVFLLRDVFDYPYGEIATILNKSEASCRQVLSRAHKHIDAHRPRFKTAPERHRQMLARFMQAVQVGDLDGLTALLTDDVTSVADGGGKAPTAAKPIYGRAAVGRFILRLLRFFQPDDSLEIATINGYAGLLIRDANGKVTTALSLNVTPDGIRNIYLMRNPDKLQRLS